MNSHLLRATIASVEDACKKRPNLRKQAATLVRDIAVVCMGLRGGVMLDYTPLSSSVMLDVLADIQSQHKPSWQFTWPLLSLLHLDGCLYLAQPDVLRAQTAQLDCSHTITTTFVTIGVDNGQLLSVASPDAVQAVTVQLQTLLRTITKPDDATQGSCMYVDLDAVEGLPIMPTLSGWLLQYPVVYLANCHTAEPLARLLSDSVLNLYQVHIIGTWMRELQSQYPGSEQLKCLYAFTVPEKLISECTPAIESWQASTPGLLDGPEQSSEIVCHRLHPHRVQL